jgi:hypothetical protein
MVKKEQEVRNSDKLKKESLFSMIRLKAKMNRDSVFPVDREEGDVALTISLVS